MYHLVRIRKMLGGIKYLMTLVQLAAGEVEICTEENWDTKIVNSVYTMVYGGLNFKINNRFY